MQYDIQAFSLPKVGESLSTNQDRLASCPDRGLFAISDGAGSSLYPGEWARLLAYGFCQREPSERLSPEVMKRWLAPLQQEWRQFYLEKLQAPNKKWWQGGSTAKSHGAATLLGLVLSPPDAQDKWSAIAVGDSCLFQYRAEDQSLVSFPLQSSAAFKSTTACLASLPEYPSSQPLLKEGPYRPGDCFLLATDALSQFVLANHEQQKQDWQDLLSVSDDQAFSGVVEQWRGRRQLKNDDTSLIRIQTLPD